MTSLVAPDSQIEERIGAIDWARVTAHLDAHGWAMLDDLLDARQCEIIAGLYDDDTRFRSHVVMARHGFGQGEYKCFPFR
jgi:hypothetical protein